MAKRFALTLTLAVAAFVVLLACGTGSAPIRIGFSGQFTGPLSDLGVQGRNGAQLAVEEINAAGGVNGHPLELVAEDDQDTPEGAKQADAQLLDKGVVAIIGHMTSSQTLAVMPDMQAWNAVLVSPTTATPLLEGKPDNFFRLISANTQWAMDLAQYAKSEGLGRAFLVGDTDNVGYTDTFLNTFEKRYRAEGGELAGKRLFSSKRGVRWGEVAAEIRAAKPTVLIACTSARDLAGLAQALRPTERGLRVLGPAWPSTRDLVDTGGKDVEGFEFVSNYAEDNPHPSFTAFRERYRKRFGWTPNFAAAFAYESVSLLAHALGKTGGERTGLETALTDGARHEGIIGPFSLDANGDIRRPIFIIQVQRGGFVTKTTTGVAP